MFRGRYGYIKKKYSKRNSLLLFPIKNVSVKFKKNVLCIKKEVQFCVEQLKNFHGQEFQEISTMFRFFYDWKLLDHLRVANNECELN